MKLAIEGRRQWIAWGALMICLSGAQTAWADPLQLTVQPVTAKPGDLNDAFNVYVTNLGAAPIDVAAFNFEISTTSSDITFEQATTGTTLFPYVFAGNSGFGPVVSTSSPGQTLDASDVAAAPNSFTVINPATSFGLGLISFDVAPGAASQVAPVSLNTNLAFTSVSDQFGNLQTLEFAPGDITVSAVPEPSTGMLVLAPLAGLIWRKRFRRWK